MASIGDCEGSLDILRSRAANMVIPDVAEYRLSQGSRLTTGLDTKISPLGSALKEFEDDE
jgi:hypothetical protein